MIGRMSENDAPRQVCRHSKNFLIKKIPHSDEKGDECSGNNGNIEEAQPGKSWDLAPYTVAKKHQCQGDGYNGSVASQPPFPNAEKFPWIAPIGRRFFIKQKVAQSRSHDGRDHHVHSESICEHEGFFSR